MSKLVFCISGLMGSGVRTARGHLHDYHEGGLVDDRSGAIDEIRRMRESLVIVSGIEPERIEAYKAAFGHRFFSLNVEARYGIRLARINARREREGEGLLTEKALDALDERAPVHEPTSKLFILENDAEREFFFAALHTAYWYARLFVRETEEAEAGTHERVAC